MQHDFARQLVDPLDVNGVFKAHCVKAAGADFRLTTVQQHQVVIKNFRHHAVAGNPHKHHTPWVALAPQKIAAKGIAPFTVRAHLKAAGSGRKPRFSQRHDDQLTFAIHLRAGQLPFRRFWQAHRATPKKQPMGIDAGRGGAGLHPGRGHFTALSRAADGLGRNAQSTRQFGIGLRAKRLHKTLQCSIALKRNSMRHMRSSVRREPDRAPDRERHPQTVRRPQTRRAKFARVEQLLLIFSQPHQKKQEKTYLTKENKLFMNDRKKKLMACQRDFFAVGLFFERDM